MGCPLLLPVPPEEGAEVGVVVVFGVLLGTDPGVCDCVVVFGTVVAIGGFKSSPLCGGLKSASDMTQPADQK